jgi:hypothetical protein
VDVIGSVSEDQPKDDGAIAQLFGEIVFCVGIQPTPALLTTTHGQTKPQHMQNPWPSSM